MGRKKQKTSNRQRSNRQMSEPKGLPDEMHDEVDVFLRNKEKISLDVNDGSDSYESDNNEIVFGLDGVESDSDDEDMYAASAGLPKMKNEREIQVPESSAWGKKKSLYYSTETADIDVGDFDEELADEEEAEAIKLENKKYEGMDENDYVLDLEDDVTTSTNVEVKKKKNKSKKSKKKKLMIDDAALLQSVSHDLDNIDILSGKEKISVEALEKKAVAVSTDDKIQRILTDSPELVGLVEEYKVYITALKDHLNPALKALNDSNVNKASDDLKKYFRMKYLLVVSYCTHITYYLMLKAEDHLRRDHPIFEKLVSLRELLDRLAPLEDLFHEKLEELLMSNGGTAGSIENRSIPKKNSTKSTDKTTKQVKVSNTNRDMNVNTSSASESGFDNADGAVRRGITIDRSAREREERSLERMGDNSITTKDEHRKTTRKNKKNKHTINGNTKNVENLDYGDSDEDTSLNMRHNSDQQKRKVRSLAMFENETVQLVRNSKNKRIFGGDDDLEWTDSKIASSKRKRGTDNDGYSDDDEGMFGGFAEDASQSQTGVMEEQQEVSEDEYYLNVAAAKQRKKAAKEELYTVKPLLTAPQTELEDGESRPANKRILKNRGLVPHRAKINRNPRVKKRVKYDKAVKRRKGAVAPMRTGETEHYGGEVTGIRKNLSRSRRLL